MDETLRQVLCGYPQDVINVTEVSSVKIGNSLDSYYKSWDHFHPIILSAQTGSGKNYFVREKLLTHAMETGASIIYLSNRVALSVQQKKYFLEKLGMPDRYGEKLRDMEQFGPITVWSYQKAYQRARETASFFSQRRGYVVFDESHYFLSDSTFNSSTEKTLFSLISLFPQFTRIYMTATPYDVLPTILDYELQQRSISGNVFSQDIHSPTSQMPPSPPLSSGSFAELYQFDRDYSAYDITFFNREDDLIPALEKANANNKWLFFVRSRAKANDLKRQVDKSEIFTASDKTENNECWKNLCDGRFPHKTNVLFSTSVIDNGVNITDDSVNNIVVTTFDRTPLLQMIGRCRLHEGKQLKVFIKIPDGEEVRNHLDYIEPLLNALSSYYQYDVANKYYFIQNMWMSLTDDIRALFFFNETNILTSNALAERELKRQSNFYSHVLFDLQRPDAKSDESILPRYVLSWLNRSSDSYTEMLWLNSDLDRKLKEELMKLLSGEDIINKDRQENFYTSFIEIAEKIGHPKRYFTNDKRSGMATINKHLERLNFPFELVHVEGNWSINKKTLISAPIKP